MIKGDISCIETVHIANLEIRQGSSHTLMPSWNGSTLYHPGSVFSMSWDRLKVMLKLKLSLKKEKNYLG